MRSHALLGRSLSAAIAFGLVVSIAGCGSKEPPAPATTTAVPPAAETTAAQAPPAAAAPAAAASAAPATQSALPTSWTPEALEELLAPVALYPDPVLSQVLIAATNPQEVLDAGNWLLQNQNLTGKALDAAATQIGFTPPIRALIQFPETVDMMCMELDWTTELGQAFVADQQGVLDAVQRLRKQAMDVGNLKSSPQMQVETEKEGGQEVVVLKPAADQKVYVPQYDPVAVYAPPPPAAAPAAAAPAEVAAPATTTTTTTTTSEGHSTGTLVATGLLAFGAGMLVNELFDDDDHHYDNDYWYPNYGYGGMPYYPPYPYRPAYGNGYYPSNGYNRPPNYQHGFNNNNIVVINNGENGYWNDRDRRRNQYQGASTYQARSPISQAKSNRPELQELNKRQPRPMPADAKRPVKGAEPAQWKGQSSYAGAKPGATRPGKASAATAATSDRPAPKVQGSYKGGTVDRDKASQGGYAGASKAKPQVERPSTRETPSANRPAPANASGKGDRGYTKPDARPANVERPQPAAPRPAASPSDRSSQAGTSRQQPKSTAMSGASRSGQAERAASQRGKQSMPQGARSKGGGGGGGGRSGGGGGGNKGRR